MSKYTIEHACGHETTQQMYGKITDRESKAEWWATVDCPACYARKQAEIRHNARIHADDKRNQWARVGIYVGARFANPSQGRAIEIIDIDAQYEDVATIREIGGAGGTTSGVKISGIIKAISGGKVVAVKATGEVAR